MAQSVQINLSAAYKKSRYLTLGILVYMLTNPFGSINMMISVPGVLVYMFCFFKAIDGGGLFFTQRVRGWIFFLLFLLNAIAIARGVMSIDRWSLSAFTGSKAFLPYLFPLVLTIDPRRYDWAFLARCCSFLALLIAVLVAVNYNALRIYRAVAEVNAAAGYEEFSIVGDWILALFAPYVLFLLRDYLKSVDWKCAAVNIFVALFVVIFCARRSSIFEVGMVLILGYFGVMRREKSSKSTWLMFGALVIGLCLFQFTDVFDFLMFRLDQDTRSGVVESFKADMTTRDWWIGRGALGKYYDPGFAHIQSVYYVTDGMRNEVETGYLYMILKGGIVYLVTYILALLTCVYKGFFKSKNTFTRAFAVVIFVSLLSLIPYGVPTFNLKFFSFWIGAAVCLNPYVRKMTNDEIKQFLKLK